MKDEPYQTFDHKGYTLVSLPKSPNETQHQACTRCVRHIFGGAFKCMELPSCAGIYFKIASSLTPEENAAMVAYKLEGHT